MVDQHTAVEIVGISAETNVQPIFVAECRVVVGLLAGLEVVGSTMMNLIMHNCSSLFPRSLMVR